MYIITIMIQYYIFGCLFGSYRISLKFTHPHAVHMQAKCGELIPAMLVVVGICLKEDMQDELISIFELFNDLVESVPHRITPHLSCYFMCVFLMHDIII